MSKDDKIMHELGEVKGELIGINKRLDKLNGSVGKNKDDINKINITIAKVGGIIVVVTALLAGLWELLKVYISSKLGV